MANTSSLKQHKSTSFVMQNIARYLWPSKNPIIKIRVVSAVLCVILSKVTSVYVPYLYKIIIEQLPLLPTMAAVPVGLLLAYGGTKIVQALFSELKDFVFTDVTHHAMYSAELDAFTHLHKLDLQFHLSRKTGLLTRVLQRGVKSIDTILRFSAFNIVPIILEVILVCIVLLYLFAPIYTYITVATLLSYVFFTIVVTKWRTGLLRQLNQSLDEASHKAIDSLFNYETVKYFNNESFEIQRLSAQLFKARQRGVKNMQSLSYLNFGQQIIIAIGVTLIMVYAAVDVMHNTLSLGDFVMLNAYVLQLAMPLGFLGFAYREIKMALVDAEQFFALLKQEPLVKDYENAKALQVSGGEIAFQNVCFAYDERPILQDVSFTVPAGKTTAIVGQSGAGKSTISRLLCDFYRPTSGAILIDGQNTSMVTQDSVRQNIGVVPQDTVLFNETILYNIRYGRPSATDEEVLTAAKLANIHNFIGSLTHGYETMVGERGLKLSGGEKQRIAIARTILKQPKIFLFDEATSALDSKTEKAIQGSLEELSAHRTTLIIAHRLSTITHADEIIVLDHGKIIERGTHAVLMHQQGVYRSMWMRQQEH